jgi:hypothetical protein
MTKINANQGQRAFISSTLSELAEHRRAVVEACRRVGVEPLVSEYMQPTGLDVMSEIRLMLDQADIYIGIIAFRYGYVPPGHEKSLIHLEYQRARERDIPCLMFMMSKDHPIRIQDIDIGPEAKKLELFKSELRRDNKVTEFSSADELKAAIVTNLVTLQSSQSERVTPLSALLLLPFSRQYDELRYFLEKQLAREGLKVIRSDTIEAGTFLINAFEDAIRKADFVIADVTDTNPNIMYEVGYVYALRKPMILLAASNAKMPFNLSSFRILIYDMNNFYTLERPLARILQEFTREGSR